MSFSKAGEYILKLIATDGLAESEDQVKIMVEDIEDLYIRSRYRKRSGKFKLNIDINNQNNSSLNFEQLNCSIDLYLALKKNANSKLRKHLVKSIPVTSQSVAFDLRKLPGIKVRKTRKARLVVLGDLNCEGFAVLESNQSKVSKVFHTEDTVSFKRWRRLFKRRLAKVQKF